MKTTFIDPLSDPAWDRLAGAHPEFSFFHSSAWAKVLHSTYRHQPVYQSFTDEGELTALLPMMEVRSPFSGTRGVCLPFTDSCGPLYFGESAPSEIVLDHLMKLARQRKWNHFEVRGNGEFLPAGTPSVEFYNHTLDLKNGPEAMRSQLASPVRRAIQKAERNGLVVAMGTEEQAVLDFYRLHMQTRKRHGVPPQPFSFFQNIHEHVLKAGLGFIALAHWKSRPVAGAVFFHIGKKGIYKFGASDASLNELRGNNLAMWEGIKSLSEQGFETLDFGRTSLGNDGLRRFKRSWGARESTMKYSKFDNTKQTWVEGRDKAAGIHNSIFKNLPLPLNRLAGALLYSHLD